jgi:DNA-damage-inducible protein D
MREMADMLRTDVKTMTNWLVEISIFRRQVSAAGGARNMPRTPHQDSGRFIVKMESNGRGVSFPVVYATAQGLDLVDDLWKQKAVTLP